jgi:hypothetical protein
MFNTLPTTTWAPVDPFTLAARAGSTIVGSQILLLVKAFNAFPGFVTKMKDGKVKIYTFTEMAEDTVVVLDLRNGKPQ